MAFDASDTSSLLSSAHHYYVAVDRVQFKMEALVGLLGVVAGGRRSLPIVLCCSSRDELDGVCSTVSNLSYISLDSLYSDLAEPRRTQILDNFRQATAEWNQSSSVQSVDNKNENEENKSHLIVVTDVCLPLLASGEAPLSARVLINYELPTKKEIYVRRMSTCLAADGIVINLVGGGEVVTMRSIEETLGFVIAEMPIETCFLEIKDRDPSHNLEKATHQLLLSPLKNELTGFLLFGSNSVKKAEARFPIY